MRDLHQVLDAKPLILEDEPVVELLGRYYVERSGKETERFQSPGARMLRSHVVLRSRFTEDRLHESLSRGVEQFVILGAGYDTFFARQPGWATSLRIFEIDQAATQEDKLARIQAARLQVPANVVFGSVNFEEESLADGLRRHGVRFDVPTLFSWLGVTMYLTEPAIDATLSSVLSFPPGSEIVLTFAMRQSADEPTTLAARAADVGEPWLTFYEPDEIERKLRHAGFSDVQLVTPEIAKARYFPGRTDELPPPRKTSLLSAIV